MFLKNNYVFLFILSFYISGCASVGTPEGGAKDESAPKIVTSNPKNRSLSVKQNSLILEFDEEVRLKDISRQILITPNLNNPFNATANKKTVKLEFDKPFEQNTTYFINFRGAIEDVTEGNKPTNLALTFSTGTFIDSGQVAGNVRELYSNAVEKGINVVLLPAKDTTVIRKHRPYYITQTDEKGNYKLQNIKFGEYRIYAHNDRNNNTIYDNEAERIGYRNAFININNSTPPVDLITLRVDTKKPLIEASTKYTDEFDISFNEGITFLKVVPLTEPANTSQFISLVDKTGKVATLYPKSSPAPKGQFIITATDSAQNSLIDTVTIAFEGKKAPRPQELYEVKNFNGQINKDELLQLTFQTPIKLVNPQAITLIQDSVLRQPLTSPQDFKLNDIGTVLTFTQTLKAKKEIEIAIDTIRLVPISGDKFRKQNRKFQITNKVLVGGLLGKINTSYKRYWVEIINKSGVVVYTLDSPKEIKLDKVIPDTYTIRVKIDENNDGKWQAGNKDLSTMAERIYHYPIASEVRENWEVVLDPPLKF